VESSLVNDVGFNFEKIKRVLSCKGPGCSPGSFLLLLLREAVRGLIGNVERYYVGISSIISHTATKALDILQGLFFGLPEHRPRLVRPSSFL
jgi:hypothetical protein